MSLPALNLQADAIRETTFLMEEPHQRPAMERLEQVAVPTLAIAGDMDDDTVMAIADMLVKRIPEARKAIIHGTATCQGWRSPRSSIRLFWGSW